MSISKDISAKQEKQIRQMINGVTTPNSGGTRFGGGDILTNKFLVEAKTKTSESKSFAIKKDWLIKAQEQAFEQGKSYSALAFRFGPDESDYYVISDELFLYLINVLED